MVGSRWVRRFVWVRLHITLSCGSHLGAVSCHAYYTIYPLPNSIPYSPYNVTSSHRVHANGWTGHHRVVGVSARREKEISSEVSHTPHTYSVFPWLQVHGYRCCYCYRLIVIFCWLSLFRVYQCFHGYIGRWIGRVLHVVPVIIVLSLIRGRGKGQGLRTRRKLTRKWKR